MPIGMLMYSTEAGEVIKSLPSPTYSEVAARDHFAKQFSYWLNSAGSRESLRAVVDPLVFDLVDSLPEVEVSSASSVQWGAQEEWGINLGTWSTMFDVRDTSGHLVGRVQLLKPAVGMSTIGMIASVGDVRQLERAQKVAKADRRPGAILFADRRRQLDCRAECPPRTISLFPGGSFERRTSAWWTPVGLSAVIWVMA